MELLEKTKRVLRTYGIIPKKRLGQNFLADASILGKMVSYASLDEGDVVLEIGAGLGFFTELLAERAERVVAVEVDPRLMKILKDRLGGLGNVSILHGDILEITLPPFNKVVSTPPYSISSPLLFWLLEKKFELAVLTFQKEFAERLAAPAGSRDYGRLTVTTYYRADVELLDLVPRGTFWPPPDVDSMIVRLKPRKPSFRVENEGVFLEVVRALFTQKNKKVRNAIMPILNQFKIPKGEAVKLADLLPFHYRRVRELAPEEIGLIADEIAKLAEEKRV